MRELTDLSIADVAALRSITACPMPVAAGRDLIREGDQTGPMLVVLEGWLCRYKILPNGSRQIMAFLMPGDSCDLHIKLLTEMDYSIQAITPAQVAKVSRDEMDAMMRKHPNVARAMYIAQLIDEGVLRAWIVSMGRRNSIERIAHLVCELFAAAPHIRARRRDIKKTPALGFRLTTNANLALIHVAIRILC